MCRCHGLFLILLVIVVINHLSFVGFGKFLSNNHDSVANLVVG